MSAEVISFDAASASRFIEQAFAGFLIDPADSEYQQGFLGALIVLYEEGLGKGADDDRMMILKGQANAPLALSQD